MLKRRFLLSFVLGLVILFSYGVYAANCGGAVACSCGDTLTSSRTLTGSDALNNCSGYSYGLIISASDIVLDCKGQNISSLVAYTAWRGLNIQSQSNVTITGCNFMGFESSIYTSSVQNLTIYNNSFEDSEYYAAQFEYDSHNISFYNNRINSGSTGVYLYSSYYFNIYNNNITNMTNAGVFLSQSLYGTISNNIFYNVQTGIDLQSNSNSNVLFSNTINNSYQGIYSYYSSNNNVSANTLCSNGHDDISFSISSGNYGNNTCDNLFSTGSANLACSNRCPFVSGECSQKVYSNVTLTRDVLDCTYNALQIKNSSITLDCDGHTISGIGDEEGIIAGAGYDNLTIKNCIIDNFYRGMEISSDYNIISNNQLKNSYINLYLNGLDNSSVLNNIINNSLGYGIYLDGINNNVTGNNLSFSDERNIFLTDYSTNNNVSNNELCFAEINDFWIDWSSYNNYGANIFDTILDDNGTNFIEKSTSCILPEFIQGECGQWLENDLTLTDDLNCVTGNGIKIKADNIIIDCQGHSIVGDGSGKGISNLNAYDNVIIKNCNISNFDYGVYVSNSENNTLNLSVENCSFSNNDDYNYGVYFYNVNNSKVIDSTFYYNNNGIYAEYSYLNNFSNNNLTSNQIGVYLDSDADNNFVMNNRFVNNSVGFYLYEADNNQIGNNFVNTSVSNIEDASSSCPLVYAWNGNSKEFVTDYSSSGRLVTSRSGKQRVYYDYLKIPAQNIVPLNNSYQFSITEEQDEISYLDEVSLVTIDHSPEVDVYPGFALSDKNKIFTIDKARLTEVSCSYVSNGANCSKEIAHGDEVYTNVLNKSNMIELNLGNISNLDNIKLIFTYARKLSSSDEVRNWEIQVKNAKGDWEDMFTDKNLISLPNAPNTHVLDLTGKVIREGLIRIRLDEGMLDYVALDSSDQQEIQINSYSPEYADLHHRGFSAHSEFMEDYDYNSLVNEQHITGSGNFTKYGSVNDLLTKTDDKYAVMSSGDEINLSYAYIQPVEGMQRDFMLYSWYYYKPAKNYMSNFRSDPLPFIGMTNYPYNETRVLSEDISNYLSEYNTREVFAPAAGSLPYSINNTVFENTIIGSGSYASDYGLYLYEEQGTVLRNNNISDLYYGIYVYYSDSLVIEGNNISNVYDGIDITEDSYNCSINDNYVSTLHGRGMLIHSSSYDNNVTNNTIISNSTFGCDFGGVGCGAVFVGDSWNNLFQNNNLTSFNGYGFVIGNSDSTGNRFLDNNVTSSDYSFYLYSSATENTILRNRITSNYWVDDESDGNYYNDSYSGNIYYLLDGSSSWYYYSDWNFYSIDDNGDGWADSGFVPFDSLHSQNSEWSQSGTDWHPAITDYPSSRSVEVNLVSPIEDANVTSPVSFNYNVSAGWNGQEIEYCNLTVSLSEEIDPAKQEGLVGLWHFNDNFNDNSGMSNNGVGVDTSFISSGKFDSALNFSNDLDSATQYVDFGDGESLQITGNITLSAWVKLTEAGDYSHIKAVISKFLFSGSEGGGYELGIWNDDKIYFSVSESSGDGYSMQSDDTLSLNEWHLITATYDGQTPKLYIDGVLSGIDESFSGALGDSGTNLYIGKRPDTEAETWPFYGGYIDEAAVWNKALTNDEIADIYISSLRGSSSSISLDAEESISLSLDNGDYTWNVECTDDSGVIGTSDTRRINVVSSASQAVQETAEEIIPSGIPNTYYSDEQLPTSGNNFKMSLNDKIRFKVKIENHTLTLNSFDSNSAKVTLQSTPMVVYLEKGKLYEFDVSGDGKNDVRVRYDGMYKTKAMIFIQEIDFDKDLVSYSPESGSDERIFNSKSFNTMILVYLGICVLLIVSGVIGYKFYREHRYYHRGY